MRPIDKFLNNITMYRLLVLGLSVMAAYAGALSLIGQLGYSFFSMSASLGVLVLCGYLANRILIIAFNSASGAGSWLITVLILFLIMKPAETLGEFAVLALAAVIAMASKYVLALKNRHIFNPAAISLVILGLLGSGGIFWWVGSSVMLPVVAAMGTLFVRKTRRFHMVWPFAAATVLTSVVMHPDSSGLAGLWTNLVLSGPIVFLATVMLTEPATTPPRRPWRMLYAALVGLLYSLSFHFGPVYSSPELALVLGNLFSYAVSYKRRLKLRLARSTQVADGVYEFAFTPPEPLKFRPGQYLEWTLPHHHPDSRGTRRYFTIASAPEESEVKIGARIDPAKSSTFKKTMLALQPGDAIWASALAGDFTLPKNPRHRLVCIAGGIGVTPFRSMISHIVATGQKANLTLFYASPTATGFSYTDVLTAATARAGVEVHYVITGPNVPPDWSGKTGRITAAMIRSAVPDYATARFYVSGPDAMVTNYKHVIRSLGVPARHIKTDYFPGF